MSRTRKNATRTPSERLRGVFFRHWENDSEDFDEFEVYYEYKMEKLISHYKKLLRNGTK